MKYHNLLLCFTLFAALSMHTKTRAADGFAVVELFTSEGCSSCPPADKVLSKIIRESEKNNTPVYGLSFHVDYWDYIGWKDPYSDKAFSNRQRAYAASFGSSRIYTPQMVVNGTVEFVGSTESKARKSIASARRTQNSETLNVSFKDINATTFTIEFNFNGNQQAYILNVALVERDLSQQVRRGENSGRKLSHDNVVRNFKTMKIKGPQKGEISLEIPKDIVRRNCKVIAYVQKIDNMQVIAVQQLANL